MWYTIDNCSKKPIHASGKFNCKYMTTNDQHKKESKEIIQFENSGYQGH